MYQILKTKITWVIERFGYQREEFFNVLNLRLKGLSHFLSLQEIRKKRKYSFLPIK